MHSSLAAGDLERQVHAAVLNLLVATVLGAFLAVVTALLLGTGDALAILAGVALEARVAVLTGLGVVGVFATAFLAAGVIGTGVLVVTVERFSGLATAADATVSSVALVAVIAGRRGHGQVDAALFRVTAVVGASFGIVTTDLGAGLAGPIVTLVSLGALAGVITRQRLGAVDAAAGLLVAQVFGTGVAIAAVLGRPRRALAGLA